MRKNLLAVFLAVVLALCLVPWAWGEEGSAGSQPAISEKEAVEIVQKVVGDVIKPEYSFDISLESRYYTAGKKVWRLSWYDPRPRNGRSFYLSAMVDATTGELLDLNQNLVDGEPGRKLLSRREALEKAIAFIKSQHPDKFEEVTLKAGPVVYGDGRYIDLSYHFIWERQVNGIPVEGDGFNVSVDASSGAIVNYHYTWTPGIIPQQVEVLDEETVKKQVMEKLGVVLSYSGSLGAQGPTGGLRPVYRLNSALLTYVDAQKGQPLDYYGRTLSWEEVVQFDREFTYRPQGESTAGSQKPAKQITAQEGLAKAQEFFRALGKSGKVVRSGGGASIGPDGYQREFWNYTLEQEKGTGYQGPGISVEIDVFTGQVVNYHYWDSLGGQEPKGAKELTREEAQKIAEGFLNKVQPGILDHLVLAKTAGSPYSQDDGLYHFNWIRLVNGIPSDWDGIHVAIHKGTGEVVSYEYNWWEGRFAAPQEIISAQQAKEILAQNLKPVLAYVQPNRFGEQPGQPILVYRFEYPQGYLVDAQSGELLRSFVAVEQPLEEKTASQAMALLRASGFIPVSATEDTLVTRRQALKAIMAMRNWQGPVYGSKRPESGSFKDISPEDPDFLLIQEAVEGGLVSPGGNFHPDKYIDRETAAVWAVKALNYGKLAELPITIELPVRDAKKIAQEARNYVALALGLGLLQPQGDQFKPQEPLNWGEMAELVVRGALYSRTGY